MDLLPFRRSRAAVPAGSPPSSPPQSSPARQRLAALIERRAALVQQLHDAAEPCRLAAAAKVRRDAAHARLGDLFDADAALLKVWTTNPTGTLPPPPVDEADCEREVAAAEREFHQLSTAAKAAKLTCDAIETELHAVIIQQREQVQLVIREVVEELAGELDEARYRVAALEGALSGLGTADQLAINTFTPKPIDLTARGVICGRLALAKNSDDFLGLAAAEAELAAYDRRERLKDNSMSIEQQHRSALAVTVEAVRRALQPRDRTIDTAAQRNRDALRQLEERLIGDAGAALEIATEPPANSDAAA